MRKVKEELVPVKIIFAFLDWWLRDGKGIRLIKTLILASLPLLCCLIHCAGTGNSIADVYLPQSEWNDELFYFKQVEAIVNYGYPQGYYGFNESHALKLSFAAWSPVLVMPWILWGLVFGWNLLSPVICNIVLLTIAVFLFAWLVRPTWKQLVVCSLLFCLYTPFVRYMLSGMPEVICFSFLIVFYGLAWNYLQDEKGYKLGILFAIAGLLTLMRPYLLLFLLLPAFLWVRKKKWIGVVGSGVIFAVVLAAYALIKHYLGAEYFAPLFFTDWITTFFEEGFGAGVHNFFATLYYMGKEFLRHTEEGVSNGLASGAFFGAYLTMLAVLLWQSLADFFAWRKTVREADAKEEQTKQETKDSTLVYRLILEGHLAISFVGMLFALLLMYKLTEGSKHLLTFMAAGIFAVALMKTKKYRKVVIIGTVFAYLLGYNAVEPYDYQVPYVQQELVAQVETWRDVYQEKLEVTEENTPSYDNAVIWVFNDKVEGNYVNTKWQLLYGLPEGMGISCCMQDYVKNQFENLQCRYLAVVSGGEIADMCEEADFEKLFEDEDMVLYARY